MASDGLRELVAQGGEAGGHCGEVSTLVLVPEVVRALKAAGHLETRFNWSFLTNPDASDQRPEAAGLGVAILGSTYMMLIVFALGNRSFISGITTGSFGGR